MNIEHLEMDMESAKKEFESYQEVMKSKNDKWIKESANMYRFLKEGKKVIDVYNVFKKSGLKNDLPKLAIAPADRNNIIFKKSASGSGRFGYQVKTTWGWTMHFIIHCPRETFNYRFKVKRGDNYFEAGTPIIPARLMPSDSLSNYFVLWEVEKWNKIEVPPKPDPYLLKRITENLFVVLASWELTDLERAIIRRG